jgi:Na+-translocating ferredoxin:NAD+ oxidoreductase subunit B
MPIRFGRHGRGIGHEIASGHRRFGRPFGAGRPENCICPACNTILPHKAGRPCFQIRCPNCGTFLVRQFAIPESHTRPGPDTARGAERAKDAVPKIDKDVCTGCKKCMDVCPTGAISIIDKKAVVNPYICNRCRACVPVCPVGAIQ